jgi:hypothetical protein
MAAFSSVPTTGPELPLRPRTSETGRSHYFNRANNGFDATIDLKHADTRILVLSVSLEFVLLIRRIAEKFASGNFERRVS